jgi:Mor family transcriptional regulator
MNTTNSKNLTAGQAEDAAVQLQHDMVAIVREEIGMHESIAALFADALVRGLRRRMGGRELYIPAADRSARDAAIRREFDGSNLKEVMARHGVSRTRVYEICGQNTTRQPRIGVSSPKSPVIPLETGQGQG